MSKILDFSSFYAPYGSELLLLRYHILKDYVDEFILAEANKSHSGIPVEFKSKKRIKEWGLPEDRFRVIEVDIPPDDELQIETVDILNCFDFYGENTQRNIESQRSRARDRMTKNAILEILHEYTDDTVIFHGDIDEIVNPLYIDPAVKIVRENPDDYLLFPLIYLEGRADLRVYNIHTNGPEAWYSSLFCCTKSLLDKVTPLNIRANKLLPKGTHHIFMTNADTGEHLQDIGWHFSWMGGKEAKLAKRNSWSHHFDKFNWLVSEEYKSNKMEEFLSQTYKDGDIPPCGNRNFILKDFPKSELPKEIWDLPMVEKFLFP